MQKWKTVPLLAAMLLCMSCGRKAEEPAAMPEPVPGMGTLTVTFPFTRQSGIASNQFAVWVEDGDGTYLGTLFATGFTARGGWEKRPEALPVWTARAGAGTLSEEAVDAAAGATPDTGIFSCRWDGRNAQGDPVHPEVCRVFVDAALRWENRVLYSAEIRLGPDTAETAAEAEYFGESGKERGMIGPVTVRWEPPRDKD